MHTRTQTCTHARARTHTPRFAPRRRTHAHTRAQVRTICARAYHALFIRNMLIKPTDEELKTFGTPDFVIYNAGQFPANR